MAIITINKTSSLDAPIVTEKLQGTIFTHENNAHQFVIHCTKNGEDYPLTGSVTARFLRSDNTTVLLGHGASDGRQYNTSLSNGDAVVTLHKDCYNAPGVFMLTVFVTNGAEVLAIYSAAGTITLSQNGKLIDSGNVIPFSSVDQIANYLENIVPEHQEINNMVGATQNANGESGLVPQPVAGQQGKYLRGDGTWQDIRAASTTEIGGVKVGEVISDEEVSTSGDDSEEEVVEEEDWYDSDEIGYATTYVDTNGVLRAKLPGATSLAAGAVRIGTGLELEKFTIMGGGLEPIYGPSINGYVRVKQMEGATNTQNGVFGAPPAPYAGDQNKYLRGDGTWQDPISSMYNVYPIEFLPASSYDAATTGLSEATLVNPAGGIPPQSITLFVSQSASQATLTWSDNNGNIYKTDDIDLTIINNGRPIDSGTRVTILNGNTIMFANGTKQNLLPNTITQLGLDTSVLTSSVGNVSITYRKSIPATIALLQNRISSLEARISTLENS